MKYGIIGSGKIGNALARTFRRKCCEAIQAVERKDRCPPYECPSGCSGRARSASFRGRVPSICRSTPRRGLQSSACGTAWNESVPKGSAAGRIRVEQ
jgi:hypothetical protein